MRIVAAIMFLISPLFSVLYFFRRYNRVITKNLIWAFVVFYGYTFVISNDTMDANRLLSRFELARQYSGDIQGYYLRLFVFSNSKVNFLEPFIHYSVSLFTDNFQILMAVFGFIYGYFYSRNICYLIDYTQNSKLKLYNYLFLFLFIFIIGYWGINMFRFWTAVHISFYALIPYFIESKKNRLWWLVIASLLHYSLLFPTAFFLLYLIIGNRTRLYFLTFLMTFVISSINVEQVGDLMVSIFPSSFEGKINEKMSDQAVLIDEQEELGMAGRVKFLIFITINLCYIIIYLFNRLELKKHHTLYRYYSFTLVMLIVGNLGELIPRGGDRFSTVAALFCISFLFFYIQEFKLRYPLRQFITLMMPLLCIGILGYLRSALDTTNIIAIIGNPILTLFYDPHKALIYYLPFL